MRSAPSLQTEASEILLTWPDERIAVVTINRPDKRNACNRSVWRKLREAFDTAATQKATRLAVLTGAGGHFCAGDDIHDAAAARQDPETASSYAQDIQAGFDAVTAAPFPVVAAISGYCIGGGLSLAMCCDFRVGTPSAEVGIPAARLGFTYPLPQCARLMTLVGISHARKMLFEGHRIGGRTARDIGLLDECSEGDPVETAIAFASGMLDSAPLSVQASKRIFQALAAGDPTAHHDEIAALMRRIEDSEDLREGARAFAEGRKPVFFGR